jgi:hypothetical protein
VDIQVVGLILILAGLAGLEMGHRQITTRRRTDVIRRNDGTTWLEPNAPPPAHDRRGMRAQHGVMDVEPGSEQFWRMRMLDD